jgi:hypothetical protein
MSPFQEIANSASVMQPVETSSSSGAWKDHVHGIERTALYTGNTMKAVGLATLGVSMMAVGGLPGLVLGVGVAGIGHIFGSHLQASAEVNTRDEMVKNTGNENHYRNPMSVFTSKLMKPL